MIRNRSTVAIPKRQAAPRFAPAAPGAGTKAAKAACGRGVCDATRTAAAGVATRARADLPAGQKPSSDAVAARAAGVGPSFTLSVNPPLPRKKKKCALLFIRSPLCGEYSL